MATRNIPVDQAGPAVQDVMMRDPRTYPPETTVAEARAEFENPRVRLLLLARDDLFEGAIGREAINDELGGDVPLGSVAPAVGFQVEPEASVAEALELLDAEEASRLPVVSADGALVGLVCLNREGRYFCVDE